MDDILVAVDETAASNLVIAAQNFLGTQSRTGTSNVGPFVVDWSASASFGGGTVDLRAPDIVRLDDVFLNFSVGLSFGIDLSTILPDFCIPEICIPIPFLPDLCTPEICIDWPTISVGPVNHSGNVNFTADFRALASMDGPDWVVDIEIVDIPNLQLDAISTLIVTALTAAIAAALSTVPFIGPFLALATSVIGAAFGVAAITGLLGPILSLFLAGLTFRIFKEPQVQTVISASGAFDPAVAVRIDSLAATVQASDEDELILTANISPA